MTAYYLFLDTETGGLDPENNSLLTASFLITDKDGNEHSHLDLYLRPNDGVYQVTPAALRLNRLDLTDQEGVITYSEGYRALESFLGTFTATIEGSYLVPVGWNTPFDLEFIYKQIVPKQTFQKWLKSYKSIDLAAVWLYLKVIGKINGDGNRLVDAVQVIGGFDHTAHDATSDMMATRYVFFALRKLL